MVETAITLSVWLVFSLVIIRYVPHKDDKSAMDKVQQQLKIIRRELREMEQSHGR